MGAANRKSEFLRGTLDMLVLKTLDSGPRHGYGIVRRIQQCTDGTLVVEEGSLYPALHRMEKRGWVRSEWGVSESNRRAKYYRLSRLGRSQLAKEVAAWNRAQTAIELVLESAPEGTSG